MSSTDLYGQPAPAPEATKRNVFGLVAFLAAATGVLLSLVQQVLPYFVWQTLGSSGYSAVALGFSSVLTLLALVAVGFGIAGLVVRNAPRAMAAAGLALGVASLLSILVSLAAGVIADVVY